MRVISFSMAAVLLLAAGLAIFWPGRNAGPGVATVAAQAPKPPEEAKSSERASAPESSVRIGDVLNQKMDFHYTETPLKDVVSLLTDQTKVTFRLNAKTLADSGINIDAPVTFRARGMRLSTALDQFLPEMDLTYVEQEELVVITTPEDAEKQLLTIRIYDCRDLLSWPWPGMDRKANSDPPAAANAAAAPSVAAKSPPNLPTQVHDERASRLMKIITESCAPESWDEVGGPGSVSDFYGLFIVSQTDRTHRQVEHFLDKLREAAGIDEPKPVKAKVVR
jgi:hypothetical protein